jgi:hypothetical protein
VIGCAQKCGAEKEPGSGGNKGQAAAVTGSHGDPQSKVRMEQRHGREEEKVQGLAGGALCLC